MIHEIGADGVVPVHGEGDLQLRPDAIDARDQHRLAHSGKIGREQAAEAADFPEHLRPVRLPGRVLDFAFDAVAEIDVDPGAGVGFFLLVILSEAKDLTNYERRDRGRKVGSATRLARFFAALRMTGKNALAKSDKFYFRSANKVGCASSRQRFGAAFAFFHDELVELRIDRQRIVAGETGEAKLVPVLARSRAPFPRRSR